MLYSGLLNPCVKANKAHMLNIHLNSWKYRFLAKYVMIILPMSQLMTEGKLVEICKFISISFGWHYGKLTFDIL